MAVPGLPPACCGAKPSTRTECSVASAANTVSSRASTWPLASAGSAPADTWIRGLRRRLLAGRQPGRLVGPQAGDVGGRPVPGATTRMATWALPAPKLASTAGTYTLASRVPNSCRTAAVATSTSLLTGQPFQCPAPSSGPAGQGLLEHRAHLPVARRWPPRQPAEPATPRPPVPGPPRPLSAAVLAAWLPHPDRTAPGDALSVVRPPPRRRASTRAAAASSTPASTTTVITAVASAGSGPAPGTAPTAGWSWPAPRHDGVVLARGAAGPHALLSRGATAGTARPRRPPRPGLAAPAGWSGGPSGSVGAAERLVAHGPAGSRPASRSARASDRFLGRPDVLYRPGSPRPERRHQQTTRHGPAARLSRGRRPCRPARAVARAPPRRPVVARVLPHRARSMKPGTYAPNGQPRTRVRSEH